MSMIHATSPPVITVFQQPLHQLTQLQQQAPAFQARHLTIQSRCMVDDRYSFSTDSASVAQPTSVITVIPTTFLTRIVSKFYLHVATHFLPLRYGQPDCPTFFINSSTTLSQLLKNNDTTSTVWTTRLSNQS